MEIYCLMRTLLLVTGCWLLVGCQNITTQQSGSSADVKPAVVQTEQIKPTANDTVVRHSHLPIDYLINGRFIVRIDDVTSKKQLFMQHVESNTQVRVDTHGIHLNTAHVYKGTLKAGHTYEIVLIRANGF